MAPEEVYLEAGSRRTFACSVRWPGWCRSGPDADAALETLAVYARRYAAVPAAAGQRFAWRQRIPELVVVETIPGNATTDFGAPGCVPALDRVDLTAREAGRLAALVGAAWEILDRTAARSPAGLRKGPRGGGRDRDAMVEHVVSAEAAYARKLGLRPPRGAEADRDGRDALRRAITEALRAARQAPPPGSREWPAAYAARRVAWHALDHAWEMEDRAGPV